MKKVTTHNSRKASQRRGEPVSTTAQDQSSANAKSYQVIKLGVDTHGGSYTLSRMIDNQGLQPPQKMAPEAFLEFLKKQVMLAQRVVMVYEAGPYGYALYRQATALGVECLVCAPERLSRGRKRVNDKIDSRELLSRLHSYLTGNSAALRIVHVPTLQQEMSRRLARERNTYRKDRQRWIGRGRSLLHTLGIARPGRWWEMKRYQPLLQLILEQYGPQVQATIQQELERYLEMVLLMAKQLEQLTAQLRAAAQAKGGQRLRGVGLLSQELLDREIGDWNRFSNRRQVASYTGLCPGEESSGDSKMMLSIDKHGNPRIRAVLAELAWLLPRYQPDYVRLRRWQGILGEGSRASRAARKKAVVALARCLAVDLWRINTGRVKPEELGLVLAS